MAATEQAFAAQPGYLAGSQIVQSPFQFVADADTFLRIVSACSVTGVTLALQGRRLDQDGQLQVIQETHTPNSDRSVKTQDYKLGPGAVLNVTVFASAGSPLIGQCYVQVQILRNFGAVAIVLGTLIGGLITATQAQAFPGSPVQSSLDVEPVVRTIIGTQPAVNVGIIETVPTHARWQIIGIGALLTGAPNVNIQPNFGVDNGVNSWFQLRTLYQPSWALITVNFWFGTGQSFVVPSTAQGDLTHCLPTPLTLPSGSRWFLGNGGPSNQWSAPVYTVREWLDI